MTIFKSNKVLFLYIALCTIWGTTWAALKVSLQFTPPFLGVSIRFFISALILFVIMKLRKEKLMLNAISLKMYFAFGLFNFGLSYALTYWGTQYIPSGISSVMWAMLPLFITICTIISKPTKQLAWKQILGCTLGIIGTALIFFPQNQPMSKLNPIGVIAVLCAVIMAAPPNLFYKKHHKEIAPLQLSFAGQFIGAILLLIPSLLFETPTTRIFERVNLFAILYLAVFGTIIAWHIYFWLFNHLTITQISTVALIPSVIALFLGWIFLRESLSAQMLIGSAIILGGVYFMHTHEEEITHP